jgi:O-antigen ligase
MWSLYWWHPTQTHNGYLEVFLNLGWIGVAMLAVVIATGYRTVTSAVQREVPGSALMLTLFAVGIIYNFTEAAFFRMMTPAWILFLLAITKVPRLDQSVSQVAERSHKVV